MTERRICAMGEALVDLLPQPGGLMRPAIGGSPYNVALALAAFAAPAAFAGRLSEDEMGVALRAGLLAAGVDLSRVAADRRPSPLAWIEHGSAQGQARYNFYLEGTAHAPPDLTPDWLSRLVHLHVSSFSAIMGAWGHAVLAALEAARGAISTSYDVNIRPLLLPPPVKAAPLIEARVARVDLVKASDEDLAWLYPERAPDAVAEGWARAGRFVLLTRGPDGASLFGAGERLDCAAPKVEVVDTIGAGDACIAGFLASAGEAGALGAGGLAAASRESLARCLRFATYAGALTCARAGAKTPGRAEILRAAGL